MASFQDFKINKQLLQAIEDLAFDQPTEIQQKAIPTILAGHDVMGIAQTGTGKTLAYLLPILMKTKYAIATAPRALILAPTRELAIQIGENITPLIKYCDLRFTTVYGGIGAKTQIENVKKGIDILVATPGRLMDIYLKGELSLKEIKTLVLDEADKMMDMGFMPQIRKILEIIPRKRQNLLFSATMSEKIITLSEEFLEYPTKIEAAPQATTAQTIDQIIYHLPNLKTKIYFLASLLTDKEKFQRVIIFTKTKQTANNILKYLERKFGEEEVKVIHANKAQNTRINTMDAFKAGEVRILVATDVASRGIDVNLVSHVINFDVPIVHEDYVHRIGRTGRALHVGEAITFVTEAEHYHIKKIEKLIRMTIPQKTLPKDIEIFETSFEEQQAMALEVDNQRKKEDPTFKGAFHEKKNAKKDKKNPKKEKKKVKKDAKKKMIRK